MKPIIVIPWEHDFIANIFDHYFVGKDHLEDCLFVFPNKRPIYYIKEKLKTDSRIKRPLIAPFFYTISELFTVLRRNTTSIPLKNISLLDKIAILLDISRAHNNPIFKANFKDMGETKNFFPWGVRLANLFEECFNQSSKVTNIHHMEEEVDFFAAELLKGLGLIYSSYENFLTNNNLTTAGFDALQVSNNLSGEYLDSIFLNKQIFFCGFHALTKTEEALIKYTLNNYNADLIVHSDHYVCTGKNFHWSCQVFANLSKSWNAKLELLIEPSKNKQPSIKYIQGFDLHSQLNSLKISLQELDEEELYANANIQKEPLNNKNVQNLNKEANELDNCNTNNIDDLNHNKFTSKIGIVLPNSGLLMPLLHHLPNKDCNISMGYLLNRSPLFQLLNTILSLQEGKRGEEYYWKTLISLLRHPYLRMLSPLKSESFEATSNENNNENNNENIASDALLRKELHNLEYNIRNYGSPYISLKTLLEVTYLYLTEEERPPKYILTLIEEILITFINEFSSVNNLFECSIVLEKMCNLLLTNGKDLWDKFPIDAECLFRLFQSIIPELKNSMLSHKDISQETIFSILREIFVQERVPFEAQPLTGTQVMGLLESRLLSFENLYVLDAVDQFIPGSSGNDPLLPESLRHVFGLPTSKTKEQAIAYTFFRLIACSKNINLLWKENSQSVQGVISKKSRFIEELIWKQEQINKEIFESNNKELKILTNKAELKNKDNLNILISEEIQAAINKHLERRITPSMLEQYLRCPVQFLHSNVLLLKDNAANLEDSIHSDIGSIIHKSLRIFFEEYLGSLFVVTKENSSSLFDNLFEIFLDTFKRTNTYLSLPIDRIFSIEEAVNYKLKKFIQGYIDKETTIIALEKELSTYIEVNQKKYLLYGVLDRIDVRDNETLILDYKTGSVPITNKDFWFDKKLWDNIDSWTPDKKDDNLLASIYKKCKSIQMQSYLHLYLSNKSNMFDSLPNIYSGAYVELVTEGTEKHIFSKTLDLELRKKIIEELTPKLICFLVNHMTTSRCYRYKKDSYCEWCYIKNICRVNIN